MPGKEGRIEIIGSPYPTGAVQSKRVTLHHKATGYTSIIMKRLRSIPPSSSNTLMTSPDTSDWKKFRGIKETSELVVRHDYLLLKRKGNR